MTARTCADDLAALSALEAVAEMAMRALVATYRDLDREFRADESAEDISAAMLVDLCGRLLDALDDHRCCVATQLPEPDHDWPF